MNDDLTPDNGTVQVPEEPTIPQEPDSEPTIPSPEPPQPQLQDETETVDFWKRKATEQASENIVLNGKIREYETRKGIDNEPTEAELRQAFPSFDHMSDEGQELARATYKTRREAQATRQALERREAEEKWNRTLEQAVISNPSLEGKERAFKEFASKPSHRGAPVDVLVDAFLHKNGSSETVRREPQPGLETGSGGPKAIATKKGLSGTELKQLREADYKGYLEYIKNNPIEID